MDRAVVISRRNLGCGLWFGGSIGALDGTADKVTE